MLSTNLIFEKIENNEELDKNEKEFLSTQLLATESRDLFFKFLICNQNVTTDEQNKMLNTLSTMTNACTLETILEKLRYIMTNFIPQNATNFGGFPGASPTNTHEYADYYGSLAGGNYSEKYDQCSDNYSHSQSQLVKKNRKLCLEEKIINFLETNATQYQEIFLNNCDNKIDKNVYEEHIARDNDTIFEENELDRWEININPSINDFLANVYLMQQKMAKPILLNYYL